jgi:hypothetical protein
MKTILTLIFTTLILNSFAIETTETKLTAQQVASFNQIHSKSFALKELKDDSILTYWATLYIDGKQYSSTGMFGMGKGTFDPNKPQNFAVMYSDLGDSYKVVINLNGSANDFTLKKPKESKLSVHFSGVKFDKQDRLILGVDISPNSEGVIRMSKKNSTPENAKSCLVFTLKTEEFLEQR